MPEEESFSTRRHSVDEPDDALRRYRGAFCCSLGYIQLLTT